MSVKKIFMTLIIVICCVILGAFIINILLPNVTTTLINAVEDQLFNATGMKFDFNNDGTVGGTGTNQYSGTRSGGEDEINDEQTVDGFQ